MTDTVDVEEMLMKLHKIHGHRLAVLKQVFDEDREQAARVHGEAVAYAGLIRALKDYRENGEFGTAPDPERYDAYGEMSRAWLRAEELAAVEPDPEPEVGTFQ